MRHVCASVAYEARMRLPTEVERDKRAASKEGSYEARMRIRSI
jgi:hypothetical protein